MSRIDEALKQAGLTPSVEAARGLPSNALEEFPQLTEARPEPGARIDERPPWTSFDADTMAEDRVSMPRHRDSAFAERLVIHEGMTPVSVEQYRRVAAVLHYLQAERGTKVVMVASAQAGEGKTLTAANLALTLSESYRRRVLLIDADLRRPALDEVFRVPNLAGLSDVLRAEAGDPLRVIELSEWLSLLPAGKPEHDPMAGLTSGRMQQVVEEATRTFDWVILDTPPVALLSDAHLLAALAEAVVLVINAGTTPLSFVQRAIDTFGRDRIVGVVLNRVERDALKDARYYDYRYGIDGRQTTQRRGLFGFGDSAESPDVAAAEMAVPAGSNGHGQHPEGT